MAARGTVVVVPGFCGSELRASAFGLRHTVWLDYATMLAGGWRLLASQGIIPLSAGPPLGAYYGLLTQRLERHGWRVASPRIDWRRPIAENGQVLAAAVRQLAQNHGGPIHMIGHSRGGLVMRSALQVLGASGDLGLVGRCVGMGVPHQGSLAAAALLGGWQSTKILLYSLLAISEGVLAGGYRRVELNAIIAGWPATYEILPRPGSSWLNPDELAAVYSTGNYSNHGLPINGALLAAALGAWLSLPEAPASVPWVDLAGVGFDTPTGVADPTRLNSTAGMRWSLLGDGAVHREAARQAQHGWAELRTSHDRLPQDGLAIDAAHQWLIGG